MPRDGSGNFALPANTLAVSGDPISSTKFNTLVQDLEADLNVDRPIAAGGTGASTAADARTNLGITGNLYDQTASAFVLTILNDADAAAVRTTIGAGTGSGDMLKSENLSGLANYTTARTNLGLAIGTNVQAWSAKLDDVAGLAVTDGGFIVGNGTNFVLETGATAQASLGYTAADVLSKLLTVDGAGSGLDADTVDGVQGSAFGQLAGANSWTGLQQFRRTLSGTTPPTSGSDTAQVAARIGANNVGAAGVGIDFFINTSTGAAYMQAHNWNDYTTEYPLNINPNGGIVTVAGETVARVDSGTAANSGKISWGTAAPGTLAEGEIYLRHA